MNTAPHTSLYTAILLLSLATANATAQNTSPHSSHPLQQAMSSDVWRQEHRIIDLHQRAGLRERLTGVVEPRVVSEILQDRA